MSPSGQWCHLSAEPQGSVAWGGALRSRVRTYRPSLPLLLGILGVAHSVTERVPLNCHQTLNACGCQGRRPGKPQQ